MVGQAQIVGHGETLKLDPYVAIVATFVRVGPVQILRVWPQ